MKRVAEKCSEAGSEQKEVRKEKREKTQWIADVFKVLSQWLLFRFMSRDCFPSHVSVGL